VPTSLKIFLTAVAIIDDLGAIVVIALFYTDDLSLTMLVAAGAGAAVLLLLNRLRVASIGPYVIVGLVVWVCVLKSGIHATLAGVVTALAIPLRNRSGDDSPLERAEHALQPWVAFAVLPLFAFANAGVELGSAGWSTWLQGVPLGIVAGLVVGKAVGVFGASWLMIRFAGAPMPTAATWRQLFGVCVLCGIGFTMSLFIGSLAFEGQASATRPSSSSACSAARSSPRSSGSRCYGVDPQGPRCPDSGAADRARRMSRPRRAGSLPPVSGRSGFPAISRSVIAIASADSRNVMWMMVCHIRTFSE
jgi:Na+/H+ antiporter NhaA